jgi:myxalamid-type polyketide synthase MxaB
MEPIAVIGIGCRFPGAKDPDAFWTLLRDGLDAITEVPRNRWDINALYDSDPATPGKMNTRWGGFLDQVDQFDYSFFGISPREAKGMDPQQRLILEVAWEALEDSGHVPGRLAGAQVGVFVGVMSADYAHLQMSDLDVIDAYMGTGSAMSIVANRLSYFFDFRGPSIAIDTACSSSLVAVHLACQSIWNGESQPIALAGGVNLLLWPAATIFFSKAGVMAPDGRSKTFDARSNGFARSEGAAIIILKPLTRALAEGDSIYAVIRGTAINQDGRSNGLMAPNRWSQEAVLHEAYRQAGVSPGQVQYVEAHGTGTLLGDPIEATALGTVLALGRPSNRPCTIGSVKTNIGHLESAAGIAGLIKAALMLKHRMIPPSLHFREPNPHIAFDKLALRVPQTLEPWPEDARPAVAGVTSLGFGGTNAHVVLEEAPGRAPSHNQMERSMHVLTLSAHSESALNELARRFRDYLAAHPFELIPDICFTANTGRSHFGYRLAATADSSAQLREQLGVFAAKAKTTGLLSGCPEGRKAPKVAFLFTGQGSQYPGMGQYLYATQPTFRQALDLCQEICQPHLTGHLLRYLYPPNGAPSHLDETVLTQPALFALEYALAQMWMSWGIQPDVMLGHSVGEYVAACLSGVFSLEDGLKLIAARGRLMGALPPDGMMAAVMASESVVYPVIAPHIADVAIAAYNGPELLVLAGKKSSVEKVLSNLKEGGISSKPLAVSHAFHSPLMDPMLDEFAAVLKTVQFSAPQIPLVSNVTGQLLTEARCTPDYWLRHIREPVRFVQSIQFLSEQGYQIFVEVGPKPVLCGMVKRILGEKEKLLLLPSLAPAMGGASQDDWPMLLSSLANLYLRGVTVDWEGFDNRYQRRRLPLPTYPFERKRCWIELTPKPSSSALPAGRSSNALRLHPLLDEAIVSPQAHTSIFQKRLRLSSDLAIREHRIRNIPVLPAAGYIEMALVAARYHLRHPVLQLESVVMTQPLELSHGGETLAQVVVKPIEGSTGGLDFKIISRLSSLQAPVIEHLTGAVVSDVSMFPPAPLDIDSIQARCSLGVRAAELYSLLREVGIDCGPYFQSIEWLQVSEREVLARLQRPNSACQDTGYILHPSLIDGALQGLRAMFLMQNLTSVGRKLYIPFAFDRMQVFGELDGALYSYGVRSHGSVNSNDPEEILRGDVKLVDERGHVRVALDGVCLKRMPVLGSMAASALTSVLKPNLPSAAGVHLTDVPKTHPLLGKRV